MPADYLYSRTRGPLHSVQVGPHPFSRLRRFLNRGRCEHCLLPEASHPTRYWTWARARGDKSPPYR